MKKRIFTWLKIIIIVYCLIGLVIYYFQDKLLFHPEIVSRDSTYKFTAPFRELNIPYSVNANMNIIQFTTADTPAKGVVLYFHGNKRNISRYADYAPNFTKHGYEVWMIDYPGYGKSTGVFSEQMLYDWGITFYTLARARYKPEQIILYGKSLGTGIAAYVATRHDSKRIILETPYYSLPSLLGEYAPVYPVGKMVQYKIPTWKYLQNIIAPVTIFHGTDDGVIRFRNCKRLKPYLKKEDEFITLEGGSHNDLSSFSLYQHKLDSLLR